MGSVYPRGPWLWFGFTGPDGKRYLRSARLPVGREDEARAKLAELEAAIARAAPTAPPPLTYTVASWTARWAQARIEKDRWTNAKLDRIALERHVASAKLEVHGHQVPFGALRLEEVRVIHVRAWLEVMELKKLSANTVLSVYSLMNRAFRAAVREEIIETSPCQLERGELPRLAEGDPDGRPEDAMFSLRELEQLVSDQRIPLDRRVGYAVSCLGGLRQGELAALTWADYDATLEPLGRLYVSKSFTRRNRRVKSTKSGVTRWVPVHGATAALIAEWSLSGWEAMLGRRPAPADLLLPNRAGRYQTDLNLWGNLQQDLKVLGWQPRRFHDTRATFVTYAIAGGGRWEIVKHITHGVKRRSRRMQEVYVRPPWEVLCAQVQGIRLQLRGEAVLLPLRATGTELLHGSATIEEGEMEAPETPASKPLAQGEIRTRLRIDRGEAPGDNLDGSPSPEDAGAGRSASDCSAGATSAHRKLRPLVGGRLRPFRKTPKGGES